MPDYCHSWFLVEQPDNSRNISKYLHTSRRIVQSLGRLWWRDTYSIFFSFVTMIFQNCTPTLPSIIQYTACPKKKSCTLIFHWTTFCFDYGVHLLCHCFDNLMQCHIYFHPDFHCIHFWPRFCIDDRRVEPFNGVKSGLCGGQFMCENDSSFSFFGQALYINTINFTFDVM